MQWTLCGTGRRAGYFSKQFRGFTLLSSWIDKSSLLLRQSFKNCLSASVEALETIFPTLFFPKHLAAVYCLNEPKAVAQGLLNKALAIRVRVSKTVKNLFSPIFCPPFQGTGFSYFVYLKLFRIKYLLRFFKLLLGAEYIAKQFSVSASIFSRVFPRFRRSKRIGSSYTVVYH